MASRPLGESGRKTKRPKPPRAAPSSTKTVYYKPPRKPAPDPILAQLKAIFGPQQSYLQNAVSQQQAQSTAEATRKQQLYQQYAQWYGSHVPQQVQGIYSQAANEQSHFAKGFSDGMKIAQDQTAGEANKIMQTAGSPMEARIHPNANASDVLYGTGGFFPASTLSTQGAAFGAAAALMPGAIVAEGGRQAQKIREAADASIAKLQGQLLDLQTKAAQAGLTLSESRRKERIQLRLEKLKMRIAAQKEAFDQELALKKFGLDISKEEFDRLYKGKQLDLSAARIDISAGNMALSSGRLDLAKWKAAQPIFRKVGDSLIAIDPATKDWAVLVKGKAKSKWSESAKVRYRSQANTWAAGAGPAGLSLPALLATLPKEPFPASFGIAALKKYYGPELVGALVTAGKLLKGTESFLRAFGVRRPKAAAAAKGGRKNTSASGTSAVREMFYDPLGAFDEGSWIGPIGGHTNHVHISFGNAQEALRMMTMARRMGLRVGENPYYDTVDPVHTQGSYHYRNFPGSYNGRSLGMAADFSGSSAAMARFFNWVRSTYLGGGRGV